MKSSAPCEVTWLGITDLHLVKLQWSAGDDDGDPEWRRPHRMQLARGWSDYGASSFHWTVHGRCQMRVKSQVCYKREADCYLLAHLERRLIYKPTNEAEIWNSKVVFYLFLLWRFLQTVFSAEMEEIMAEGRSCVQERSSAAANKYLASKMSWKHQKSNVFCLQFMWEFVLDVRYLGFSPSVNLLSDVRRPVKHQEVYSELWKICLQFLVQKTRGFNQQHERDDLRRVHLSVHLCFFKTLFFDSE